MWRLSNRPGTLVAAADEANKTGLSGKGKERASKQLACKHHVDAAFVDTCVQTTLYVQCICQLLHTFSHKYTFFVKKHQEGSPCECMVVVRPPTVTTLCLVTKPIKCHLTSSIYRTGG